jgi:hypothetical protein
VKRHDDEVSGMDKERVVLPHGKNAVAVPVYNIAFNIGANGQCLPGDPIGYTIGPDGRPQHVNIGFVVVPK